MPKENSDIEVSPNNPCPFLRTLVQQGLLSDDIDAIGDVAATIVKVAKTGEGSPKLPSFSIRAIALVANGLGPVSIVRNGFQGVRLNELRDGPLDKKGAGSRILDPHGLVSEAELDRLAEFGSNKEAVDGTSEPGLDEADLTRFMDENFARAKGHCRKIDRKLMNGEWPVLLKVIGKDGKNGRYLSIADVRHLFLDRVFPERMMTKIEFR